MTPRIVSLCSGYGGLDRAAEQVFDAETVAHCEWAEAPSKVLAHRWPGVPNLHDVTAADWSSIDADILTAGYPCQPFSAAGRRKGTDDERHLWPHVAEAVRRVRPRLVLLENVAGHRSLGFGDVLADLAAMRYVGSWVSVRASDVGACHGRERVFILARDAASERRDHAPAQNRGSGSSRPPRGSDLDAADTDGARSQGPQPAARRHLSDGSTAPDTEGPRCTGVDASAGGEAARSGRERFAGRGAGRPSTADADGLPLRLQSVPESGSSRAAESGHIGGDPALACCGHRRSEHDAIGCHGRLWNGCGCSCRVAVVMGELRPARVLVDWGKYEPGIRRHERILGRPAPYPSEPAPKGGRRLSPRFVEWMQMLDEGWVTDVPDVSRDDQLTILGNGVVVQQAVEATRRMLRNVARAAA